MGSLLYDGALVHDHDEICVPDGGQAVGDDQAGAAFHESVHGFLNGLLGAGIDVGCGFVQDQDVRIGQEGPADGDELTLALGQVVPGVRQHGLISVRQHGHHLVHITEGGGLPHVFIGGIGFGIGQVRPDRVRKQNRILQHDPHQVAEVRAVDVFDVHTVQQDLAAVDVIEPHQQVDDGGLAGTRRAHQGDLLAGFDLQVEVPDHRLSRNVGEIHVAEFDRAVRLGFVHRSGFVLGGSIHDLEDPLRAGDSRLDLAVELSQLVDGPRELLGVDGKGGDDTHGDVAFEGQVAPEHGNHHEGHVVQHVHDGAHGACDDLRHDPRVSQGVRSVLEVCNHGILLVVGGHRLIVGDLLLHDAVDAAQELLPLQVVPAHDPGDDAGEQHRENHHGAGQKRELPAVPEHHGHGARQGQHPGEQRRQRLGDHPGDVLGVVGHAADEVAMRVIGQVGQRQIDGFPEELGSHALHDALGEPGADLLLSEGRQAAAHVDRGHDGQDPRDPVELPHGDTVDGAAQKSRRRHLKEHRDRDDQKKQQDDFALRSEIGDETAKSVPAFLWLLHGGAHVPGPAAHGDVHVGSFAHAVPGIPGHLGLGALCILTHAAPPDFIWESQMSWYTGQVARSSSWVPQAMMVPSSSTAMRSARRAVAMRWAMMIRVWPE